MDLADSFEMRWFLPAEQHASVLRWFADAPVEDQGRADYYLRTGRDDLGIKARVAPPKPTKIETKYRLGVLRDVELLPHVSGHIESWRKLSLESSQLPPPNEPWIVVNKERRLKKFAWSDGRVSPVDASERPAAGCGFELTRLQISASTFWSIGFEAFGAGPRLLEVLSAVAREALADKTEVALRSSISAGYPEWLRMLRQNAA